MTRRGELRGSLWGQRTDWGNSTTGGSQGWSLGGRLQLVRDASKGRLEGGQIGSCEISFHPGTISGGRYLADTQTAGTNALRLCQTHKFKVPGPVKCLRASLKSPTMPARGVDCEWNCR
ncbi:RNA 3'-terminal phosphate cyclase [Chionoecetes opilio]|uniref:RNA 3'-terminal phosphate cyclase n=1 Tax=Chionoecetes opilio TaxID=41210 RepID=A0A8J4Y545_CHIOP|nr:RNA 3'-terminal phosphate cyclase [Chionoecetes opilio]